MPQEKELGGPVYDVAYRGGDAVIRFGRDVERQWKESDKRSSAMMAPKGSHVWYVRQIQSSFSYTFCHRE
jgi:hypothetical protein